MKGLVLFIKDPTAWTEAHSSRMNEAFAARLEEENRARAAAQDQPTPPKK